MMGDNSMAFMGNDSAKKKRVAFLESLAQPIDELQAQAAEEANLYATYFGFKVYDGSLFNIVEKVRAGFSMAAGKKLAHHLGVEPKVLFIHYLGMSRSTVIRREKQAKPRLNPDESDKLVRYAFLLSQATRLMEGNEEAAQEWLDSSSPALGGQTPLECATTEVGARRVEDLITSLEYGMFS
jgi:putative toxin-antitoxin system antitoxin component (TIGR02293 family)